MDQTAIQARLDATQIINSVFDKALNYLNNSSSSSTKKGDESSSSADERQCKKMDAAGGPRKSSNGKNKVKSVNGEIGKSKNKNTEVVPEQDENRFSSSSDKHNRSSSVKLSTTKCSDNDKSMYHDGGGGGGAPVPGQPRNNGQRRVSFSEEVIVKGKKKTHKAWLTSSEFSDQSFSYHDQQQPQHREDKVPTFVLPPVAKTNTDSAIEVTRL